MAALAAVSEVPVEASVVVDTVVPVVVADAEVVELAAVVLLAPEAQETAVGRSVTPAILQKLRAKSVALVWSEASHLPARQHAMLLRKFLLLQIHAMSTELHPPILSPDVAAMTQVRCIHKRS